LLLRHFKANLLGTEEDQQEEGMIVQQMKKTKALAETIKRGFEDKINDQVLQELFDE